MSRDVSAKETLFWEYCSETERFYAPDAFYSFFDIPADGHSASSNLAETLVPSEPAGMPFDVWLTSYSDKIGHFTLPKADAPIRLHWKAMQSSEGSRLVGCVEKVHGKDGLVADAASLIEALSHDIRSHINNLDGMLRTLSTTYMDEAQKSYLNYAEQSCHELNELLHNTLTMAKLERKSFTSGEYIFSINEFITRTFNEVIDHAIEKDIELAWVNLSDIPRTLKTDEATLRKALTHMLHYAIHDTDGENIVTELDYDENMFSISVKYQKHASESDTQRCFSLHSHDSPIPLHTQSGLLVIQHIMTQHSGHISHSVEENNTASFHFFIKAEEGDANFITPIETPESLNDKNILIVDDMEANGLLVSQMLEKAGAVCTTLTDPEAAKHVMLEAHKDGNPFDLALLDYVMPSLDGRALGNLIKSDKHIESTPILMMSVSDAAHLETMFRNAEFQGFILKPIDESALYALVSHALENPDSFVTSREFSNNDATYGLMTKENKKPQLLLVEDNPVNARMVRRVMTKALCDIDIVTNASATLQALETADTHYDAILMDIFINKDHGAELAKRVGEIDDSIPVIGITASLDKSLEKQCLEAGMVALLDKSDIHSLPEKISTLLPDSMIYSKQMDQPSTLQKNVTALSNYIDMKSVRELKNTLGEEDYMKALQSFHVYWKSELDGMKNAIFEGNKPSIISSSSNIEEAAEQVGIININMLTRVIQQELKGEAEMNIERLLPIHQRINDILSEFETIPEFAA